MRKIKFRAWNKKSKKYIYDIKIGQVGWMNHFHNSIGINELEFEQFTGFVDKNSKEIYEGDIVSWIFDGANVSAEIIFFNQCFCCAFSELAIPMSEYTGQNLIVVSNIHEGK